MTLLAQRVSCCVCGASEGDAFSRGWDFEYATTKEEFPFVRCRACGHVYLSPRPDERELGTIYPPDYYSYDMKRSVNPIALAAKNWLDKGRTRRLLGYAKKQVPRCLDVGCGDGRILELFARAGVPHENLHGVELSASVVETLAKKGMHGHHGRIEDLAIDGALPEASFDLIVMLQVIEHVADPKKTMAALARLLAPGGVLVVETPNVRSLDARIFRRRYWGGYHFPRHWNLFSKTTLARLGESAGLATAALETFVCAVFWIYPFHHWLRERGAPRPIYRFFWPSSNPLLLAAATAIDMVLAPLGLSSNLRGVFKKEEEKENRQDAKTPRNPE